MKFYKQIVNFLDKAIFNDYFDKIELIKIIKEYDSTISDKTCNKFINLCKSYCSEKDKIIEWNCSFYPNRVDFIKNEFENMKNKIENEIEN